MIPKFKFSPTKSNTITYQQYFLTKPKTLTSKITLPEYPRAIGVADDKTVFVTVPVSHKILHFLTPGIDLNNYNEIPVDGQCAVAKMHACKLRVLFYAPSVLTDFNETGEKLQTVNEDIRNVAVSADVLNCQARIEQPIYAEICTENESLFATCWKKNAIVEITANGQVNMLVQSEKLHNPKGIVMYKNETILVCSCGIKNVLQVSMVDGTFKEFLHNPLPFTPKAIGVNKERTQLYVGGDSDEIFVYEI